MFSSNSGVNMFIGCGERLAVSTIEGDIIRTILTDDNRDRAVFDIKVRLCTLPRASALVPSATLNSALGWLADRFFRRGRHHGYVGPLRDERPSVYGEQQPVG